MILASKRRFGPRYGLGRHRTMSEKCPTSGLMHRCKQRRYSITLSVRATRHGGPQGPKPKLTNHATDGANFSRAQNTFIVFRLTGARVEIDQPCAVFSGLISKTPVRGLCLRQLFNAHCVRKRRIAAQRRRHRKIASAPIPNVTGHQTIRRAYLLSQGRQPKAFSFQPNLLTGTV